MPDRILKDDQIKQMLGPMANAYLDAVRENEKRRNDLERRLLIAQASANEAWAEVERLSASLIAANNIIDNLSVLVSKGSGDVPPAREP